MLSDKIATLNPRHLKMVEMCLRGLTSGQIAEQLGMTLSGVSIVVKSPAFQHQLAVRRSSYDEKVDQDILEGNKEAARLLKESTVDAANNMISHMKSTDEKISIRASAEVLDRGGVPKQVEKNNHTNVGAVFVLSPEDSKRIVEAVELTTLPKERAEEPLSQGNELTGVAPALNIPQSVSSSLKENPTSQETADIEGQAR